MKNINNITSETFGLKIDENIYNRKIVDNKHTDNIENIENIEQDIDKIKCICSNDEGHIEQKEQNKENHNIESEMCDMMNYFLRQFVSWYIFVFNVTFVLIKYLENRYLLSCKH